MQPLRSSAHGSFARERLRIPGRKAGEATLGYVTDSCYAPYGAQRSNGARLPLDVPRLAAEVTAYPSEMAEMALAHTISDKVGAACRRGNLFEKRVR